MRILTTALLVSASFLSLNLAEAAPSSVVSSACLVRLVKGENRLKEKLPAVALKKLAKALQERSKTLQEDPVALLVDYSRNSKDKRAFIVDFKSCDILSADYAMHGGAYYNNKKPVFEGDKNLDGMLDTCKNKKGTRQNMTRPGLYVTKGCHETNQKGWTLIKGNCAGIKLVGLEKTNDDALKSGVVLHEHVSVKTDSSIKAMGQGCPTFAPGKLKSLLRYGIMEDTLVYVHAPQCS